MSNTLIVHTCAVCGADLTTRTAAENDDGTRGVTLKVAVSPCGKCVMFTDRYLKELEKLIEDKQNERNKTGGEV